MRPAPTILHLDMDAFYASAEQAAKPSLRGKAVVVGGLGPRGVVATASYEARRLGVHSAMPTAQARRLAPNAAYLVPRFSLYRTVSEQVMGLLGRLSPLVEPLSLDEAFVDLEAGGTADDAASARATGEGLRAAIHAVTGLSGSVGLAGSKMLAKIASEQAKPDGLVLIEPGTERDLLAPLSVRVLPGVGPATGDHLRRAGMTTVHDLAEAGEAELVRLVGKAHGHGLHRMALGLDDRPVVAERDAKSVSVEDTFDVDLHDRVRVRAEVERLAVRCVERLRAADRSGRTVRAEGAALRLLHADPLRDPQRAHGRPHGGARGGRAAAGVRGHHGRRTASGGRCHGARRLHPGGPVRPGRRRPGARPPGRGGAGTGRGDGGRESEPEPEPEEPSEPLAARRWPAGHDVHHEAHGHGWVQGSGVGRVTVRFEQPWSAPGRVLTFRVDDPRLLPADPLPLVREPPDYSSWPASLPKSRSGPDPAAGGLSSP
ncbi:DNA polymerase IV [Streptomyces californicus]